MKKIKLSESNVYKGVGAWSIWGTNGVWVSIFGALNETVTPMRLTPNEARQLAKQLKAAASRAEGSDDCA